MGESRWVDTAERTERLAWFEHCRELLEVTTAAGLGTLQSEVLTEWNEGVGPDVEEFWRRVAVAGLAVPRKRNVLAETLARGSVRNMVEYAVLEDGFELLQTSGTLRIEQAEALARMLDAFADAPKNRQHFR
ncbi:hypothetical protein A7982_13658 [Minicystis rosea]|nr:hypothetical protein A7982_13658 [Minicystis rosea]